MIFITNQTKLAAVAQVSPEHLSAVKKDRPMSEDLAKKLEKITGIPASMWLSLDKEKLKAALKDYFKREKDAEEAYIFDHVANTHSTEAIY